MVCMKANNGDLKMKTAVEMAIEFAGGQKKLAELIGVKQQTISQWSNRKAVPSVKNATMLESKTDGLITREQVFKEAFG